MSVDRGGESDALPAGCDVPRRSPHGVLRRRRPTLLVAVGFAALVALVMIVNLTGLPGVKQATPPPANAAKLVAVFDAGLTRVNTLRGTFVFDAPPSGGSSNIASVDFAATSNGDKAFDVHYRPDYKKLRQDWLSAKKSTETAIMMMSAAPVFERAVVNGPTGLIQTKTWTVNPVTRRPVGLRYRYYRGIFMSGGRVLVSPREVQQIWLLSSELRAAYAQQQPDVELTDVSYHGRPTYRAVVYGSNAKPAYVALVDKQYGITLQVSPVPGSHWDGDFSLTPFHLRDLRVNEPVDPRTFAMKPDYRYAPDGYSARRPTDTPAKYGIDLGERAFPVSAVSRNTSSWTLLPTWIPTGYTLQRAVTWPGYSWMRLTYRKGMSEIVVSTAGRTATGPPGATPYSTGYVFQSPKNYDSYWPTLVASISDMPAGAMAGWPAGHGDPTDAGISAVGTATFGVSGNVPVDVLQRMAESVHQAKPGPYLPKDRYPWQPWLVSAVAAGFAAVALFLVIRRRRRMADLGVLLPGWKSVRLPLIGLALVVTGASLPWHWMHGGGNDFSVLGWHDPLAVATVAVALLALTAATWVLAAPERSPVGPRFLASLLGLLALAVAMLSVVYLPVKARFTVNTLAFDLTWKGLSAIGTLLRGNVVPGPGPGLDLALVGACLIVVGGLRLRART